MKRPIPYFNLLLTVILATLSSLASIGQEKAYLNVSQEVTEEKFAYYTQILLRYSGDAHCLRITFGNGAVFFKGCISNSIYEAGKNRKHLGLCKWYYKNGNLKQIASYNSMGKLDGKATSCHVI